MYPKSIIKVHLSYIFHYLRTFTLVFLLEYFFGQIESQKMQKMIIYLWTWVRFVYKIDCESLQIENVKGIFDEANMVDRSKKRKRIKAA